MRRRDGVQEGGGAVEIAGADRDARSGDGTRRALLVFEFPPLRLERFERLLFQCRRFHVTRLERERLIRGPDDAVERARRHVRPCAFEGVDDGALPLTDLLLLAARVRHLTAKCLRFRQRRPSLQRLLNQRIGARERSLREQRARLVQPCGDLLIIARAVRAGEQVEHPRLLRIENGREFALLDGLLESSFVEMA